MGVSLALLGSMTEALHQLITNPWFITASGIGLLAWFRKKLLEIGKRAWYWLRLRRRTVPWETLQRLSPTTVVIHHNLTEGFAPEEIVFHWEGRYQPSEPLRALLDACHEEIEVERAAGRDHSHNGHPAGLKSFRIAADEFEVQKRIEIHLQAIRYDDTRCIGKILDQAVPGSKPEQTYRERYATVDLQSTAPPELPNPVGLGVLVETSDGWMVLCEREGRTVVSPRKFSSSVGEGMVTALGPNGGLPGDRRADGRFDINATFKRGAEEELGATAEGLASLGFGGTPFDFVFPVRWVAFVAASDALQFNFIGFCRTKLSRRALEDLHTFRSTDRDGELRFVKGPRNLLQNIEANRGQYASAGPLVLALAHRSRTP